MIGDGTVIPSRNTLDGQWSSMSETVYFAIKSRSENHCFRNIVLLYGDYLAVISRNTLLF
jgi:hypothetical protein